MPEGPTVSKSSCLIALEAVGALSILERFSKTIVVPDAVAQECGGVLPGWVQVHTVQHQPLAQSLRLNLGPGESEAVALSIELTAARRILDDQKARRIACQLNQSVTGTLAILLKAKEQGMIPRVREVIEMPLACNFRVSDTLVAGVWHRAGESGKRKGPLVTLPSHKG